MPIRMNEELRPKFKIKTIIKPRQYHRRGNSRREKRRRGLALTSKKVKRPIERCVSPHS